MSSLSSIQPKLDAQVMNNTWGERLLYNLFSYLFVLAPIAFIVLATNYKLLPRSLRTNVLVQLFVFGGSNRTNRYLNKEDDNTSLLTKDKDDKKLDQRIDNNYSKSSKDEILVFIYCFLGLLISYSIWGILQEKIMTTKYEVTSKVEPPSSSVLNNGQQQQNSSKTTSDIDEKLFINFHDSQFLVFINRIIAFILSILGLVQDRPKQQSRLMSTKTHTSYIQQEQHTKPQAPLYSYVYCSLSNILSSWCQYEALKYVNFPTQVLSKSCKIVPVMLMSKLLLRKKYQMSAYFRALLLSIGMFVFLLDQMNAKNGSHMIKQLVNQSQVTHSLETVKYLSDLESKGPNVQIESSNIVNNNGNFQQKLLNINNTISKHVTTNTSLISGLMILILYLTFDSFTSNWQQSLFTRYSISNWQMMAGTNFYSIILTLTSLQSTGSLKPAFKMLLSSRSLFIDCILMSLMSSVGQLFVYFTIKRFGSVKFTVIMTFRQFLAILLSCLIYGHRLSPISTIVLILVFFIIGLEMMRKAPARNKSGSSLSKSRFSDIELNKVDGNTRTQLSDVVTSK